MVATNPTGTFVIKVFSQVAQLSMPGCSDGMCPTRISALRLPCAEASLTYSIVSHSGTSPISSTSTSGRCNARRRCTRGTAAAVVIVIGAHVDQRWRIDDVVALAAVARGRRSDCVGSADVERAAPTNAHGGNERHRCIVDNDNAADDSSYDVGRSATLCLRAARAHDAARRAGTSVCQSRCGASVANTVFSIVEATVELKYFMNESYLLLVGALGVAAVAVKFFFLSSPNDDANDTNDDDGDASNEQERKFKSLRPAPSDLKLPTHKVECHAKIFEIFENKPLKQTATFIDLPRLAKRIDVFDGDSSLTGSDSANQEAMAGLRCSSWVCLFVLVF